MKLSNRRWMLIAVVSIVGLTLLTINTFAMGGNTTMLLNSPQNNYLAENQLLINGKTAEETILLFMKEKGIIVEKGTKQYLQFMRDILLGEYPELTRLGSKYLSSQRELDLILEYVTEQRSSLFKDFPIEAEIKEAVPGKESLYADSKPLDRNPEPVLKGNAGNTPRSEYKATAESVIDEQYLKEKNGEVKLIEYMTYAEYVKFAYKAGKTTASTQIAQDRIVLVVQVYYPDGLDHPKVGFIKNCLATGYYNAETGEYLGGSFTGNFPAESTAGPISLSAVPTERLPDE